MKTISRLVFPVSRLANPVRAAGFRYLLCLMNAGGLVEPAEKQVYPCLGSRLFTIFAHMNHVIDKGMEKKYGMDADAVRREAAVEARRQMKELSDAARKVRPLCGEVDPFAFDSAQDIYRHALESQGRDVSKYQPAAWEGIVDVMLERPMAADSAPVSTKETMLPHLDRFIR